MFTYSYRIEVYEVIGNTANMESPLYSLTGTVQAERHSHACTLSWCKINAEIERRGRKDIAVSDLDVKQLTQQTIVDTYRTGFDSYHNSTGYKDKQYQKGLEMAQNCHRIHIAVNGVWSSDNKDGSTTFAYETLGLHACTADLLRGWIDGGAVIIDHRSADKSLIPNPRND